ncbi:MAG: CHAD domain-containing protein [Acidimicrobiales bacterium]
MSAVFGPFALPASVRAVDVEAAFDGSPWTATTSRAEPTTRTFLETFDGRLLADGTVLELESPAGGERRLTWRDRSSGHARGQAALDDRSPRFAWDLPAGPLREVLAPILEVRALLPLATVRTRRATVAARDGEAKLVARVRLDHDVLIETDGRPCRRDLGPSLQVVPLRGYDREGTRIASRLADRLGVSAAPHDVVGGAFAALARPPGTYASKLRVDLDPAMSATDGAVAILQTLLATTDANLEGTLDDIDSEFLHDLRVAVRRTRSGLKAFPGVFPPGQLTRFAPGFRWVQQASGPARDLDVQVLEFDAELGHLAAEAASQLEPLRRLLDAKRTVAHRHLNRALRSVRYRRLLDRWRTFLARPTPGPEAGRPVSEVASERIWRAYRRVVKGGRAITAASPAEDLHDLRKRGKELRYLVEFFATLYPKDDVVGLVKELKAVQDNLGAFQDDQVQAANLEALGDELGSTGTPADTLMAMGQLVSHHQRTSAAARTEFAKRFATFDGPRNRRRFDDVFRSADTSTVAGGRR